jgi:U4/U6.U5 tri-snRNP component SNU23
VEDVRDRLEMLKQRKREREEEERTGGVVDLDARIKKTEEIEDKVREEKRRKRNEKRRNKGGDGKVKDEDEDGWESRLGIIC